MFYGSLSWDLALGEDLELLPQIVAPDSPRQESARGSCIGRDLGWEGWRDSLNEKFSGCSLSCLQIHLKQSHRTQCHNQMCRLRHFENSPTAWGELCVACKKRHKRRRDMQAQILAQYGSNAVGYIKCGSSTFTRLQFRDPSNSLPPSKCSAMSLCWGFWRARMDKKISCNWTKWDFGWAAMLQNTAIECNWPSIGQWIWMTWNMMCQ